MGNIINVKIDVSLIDKARLFTGKTRADGHTPKYLDLVLVPRREVGQYGDTHLVKQGVTKEEREAGVEMPILGNATERGTPKPAQAPAAKPPPKPAADARKPAELEEDVPF